MIWSSSRHEDDHVSDHTEVLDWFAGLQVGFYSIVPRLTLLSTVHQHHLRLTCQLHLKTCHSGKQAQLQVQGRELESQIKGENKR